MQKKHENKEGKTGWKQRKNKQNRTLSFFAEYEFEIEWRQS